MRDTSASARVTVALVYSWTTSSAVTRVIAHFSFIDSAPDLVRPPTGAHKMFVNG